MLTYRKKTFLSISVISLLTLFCLVFFFIHLLNIKKDTPTATFGADLIACNTAAQLVNAGEITEIYVEIKDDFSIVNSGKYYETAKSSGFHLTPTRYIYLPIFLAPFQLLTRFSFSTSALLCLSVNLFIIIAVILLEWYFTKDLPSPILRFMLITSLNLSLFPLFYALKLGQSSIIIYLVICLIYLFSMKKKDYLAGIFLGIIITLKFSPLIFTLYFFYRKRYALVFTCTLTVVAILLASILSYGLPLHKIYWNYLIKLSDLEIAAWSNQSIDAFLLRLFTKSSILYFSPIKSTAFFSIARYILTFSVIATIYLCLKRVTTSNLQRLYPLEFSAVLLCFLITPPISWLHYFTLTTLSIILIATVYFQIYPFRARIIIPLTVISYVMIAFHPNYSSLVSNFGQGYFTKVVTSFPFMGTSVILFINLLLMITFSKKNLGIVKDGKRSTG